MSVTKSLLKARGGTRSLSGEPFVNIDLSVCDMATELDEPRTEASIAPLSKRTSGDDAAEVSEQRCFVKDSGRWQSFGSAVGAEEGSFEVE